jgi:hypothetical protein
MKACGRRIKDMAKEFITILMERCIEETISLAREMALVCLIIKMEIDMKETGE